MIRNIALSSLIIFSLSFSIFGQYSNNIKVDTSNVIIIIDSLKLLSTHYSDDQFREIITPINDYESIYFIYINYVDKVNNLEQQRNRNGKQIDIEQLKNQLKIIEEKLRSFTNQKYIHYSITGLNNRKLKAINIYHDNDALLLTPWMNQDRNYTGGARFEFITDYLKLRMLDVFWKRHILSYQSFFIGGEAYTPNIQYNKSSVRDSTGVTIAIDPTTKKLDEPSKKAVDEYLYARQVNDRPFASYYYFGRTQYRIHRKGVWRCKSDVTLGYIGKQSPQEVQAFLHRDIFISSKKVLHWDKQIANGGRFAYNFDYYFDYSLPTIDNKNEKRSKFFINAEARFGTHLTSLGGGLSWSNKNLTETTSSYDLVNKRVIGEGKSKFSDHYLLETSLKLKYIIHNSLLEGIGIHKTIKSDEFDDDKISVYTLEKNEVERLVLSWDIVFSYRFGNSTFFLKNTFLTKEFNKSEAKDLYGYGRAGVNFYLN